MLSQIWCLRLIRIYLALLILILYVRLELLFECVIDHLLYVIHVWIELLLVMLGVISAVLTWIYSLRYRRVIIVSKLNAIIQTLLLLLLLLFILPKVNIVQKFKYFMLNLLVFCRRFLLVFNVDLHWRQFTGICRISLSKHLTWLKLYVILKLVLHVSPIGLIPHLLLMHLAIVQLIIDILIVDILLTQLVLKVHVGVVHEHACVSRGHLWNYYRRTLAFFATHGRHKYSTVSTLTSLSMRIIPLFLNLLSLSLLGHLKIVSAVNVRWFKWVLTTKSCGWRRKCVVVDWIP